MKHAVIGRMKGKPTIFLVDDEPAVLASIASLLQSDEWQVTRCDSAEAFLRQYDEKAPACLILDQRTPGKRGLELLTELRALGDLLPVIVITGRYDPEEAAECLARGVVAILQKPLDGGDLLECVRAALFGGDSSGFLPDLSKRLSLEEAQGLYRAILPPLVRDVFRAAGGGENECAVQRIVEHMCRTDVQTRIRQGEHVSVALAAELTTVRNDFRLKPRITNESLHQLIQRGRLHSSLLVLEGCLA